MSCTKVPKLNGDPQPPVSPCVREFQALVDRTLCGRAPQSILSSLCSLNSVPSISGSLNARGTALEAIVQALNALPTPYASSFPHLRLDTTVRELCHPLVLQIFQPIHVYTSPDDNCMYNALSTTVCGSERLTELFHLLTAYAVVKYRHVLIDALRDAFPFQTHEEHVRKCNTLIVQAITIRSWGSDYHMFALSLLLDRPILVYCSFYLNDEGVLSLTMGDTRDVADFACRFLAFRPETRRHVQLCSSANRAVLTSGDVTTIPHLPLAIFHLPNH